MFSQILSWLLKEHSSLSETPDLVISHSYSPVSRGSNHLVMFSVIFEVSKISRPHLWSVTSWDIKVCKTSVRITVWGWFVGSLVISLFSCSVVSNSLQPCGLQHARLPCPSLYPRVCSNSCPLSRWWHPTVSSFVSLFSSRLQSSPASGAFPMSQLFAASASVQPKNIQGWFSSWLTGLISLLPKGLSSLLQHHSLKASILQHSAFFMVRLSPPYLTTEKIIRLTIWTFVSKVMSLLWICCIGFS